MKLIIMTKSTFFVEEDKILVTLFEEGMDNLHLYKPLTSPVYSERLLSLIPEDFYNKITVHDHFYLKEEYRLNGIHIDTPTLTPPLNYKDNGLIDKKVYALGGMNTDNLQIARDLGFGGVVICGDLWNRFDIHNQNDYKELINHFERLRKIIS